MLDFSDRTRTGMFNVIWPLAWNKTIFRADKRRCRKTCENYLLKYHVVPSGKQLILERFRVKVSIIVLIWSLLMINIFFFIHHLLFCNMKKEKKIDTNSTQCSQAVTHPNTNRAQHYLTLVIGRELYVPWDMAVGEK